MATTTQARLAAIENKIFGSDVLRNHDGTRGERGSGSRYATKTSDQDKALLAALEALVAAERRAGETAESAARQVEEAQAALGAAEIEADRAEVAAKGARDGLEPG